MGVYPGLDGSAPVIGGECVGMVTALGDDVDSVEIGQRVIAFGPGTFGSHLTTLADLVVPVPDELSDREAATFGVAYLTAWHSLCEVGRLAPGERVLIHSATGGVGLAAVSIAKMIGARIYTTAGSDAKRELLSGLGVEYVGDSRSVEFADEILDVTDGYGVDVILNSLSGEAIRRGVQILAPGGRFVELGKKDVYADAQLGLAALAKSASFAVVDLDLNLRLQPQRYRRLLQEILGHVRDGELQPLPVTEFSLDRRDRRIPADGVRKPHRQDRHLDTGRRQHRSGRAAPPQPLVRPRRRLHRGRRHGRSRFRRRAVAGAAGRRNGCPQRAFGSQRRCCARPSTDMNADGRPSRGRHRRHRGARHRGAPGRCCRGRGTAARPACCTARRFSPTRSC